jgi:hypothetical protein
VQIFCTCTFKLNSKLKNNTSYSARILNKQNVIFYNIKFEKLSVKLPSNKFKNAGKEISPASYSRLVKYTKIQFLWYFDSFISSTFLLDPSQSLTA